MEVEAVATGDPAADQAAAVAAMEAGTAAYGHASEDLWLLFHRFAREVHEEAAAARLFAGGGTSSRVPAPADVVRRAKTAIIAPGTATAFAAALQQLS